MGNFVNLINKWNVHSIFLGMNEIRLDLMLIAEFAAPGVGYDLA